MCYLRKDDTKFPELIISPVKYEHWEECWRINCTFLNETGIVNKFLRVLAEHGVNIVMQESGSSDSRDYHEIEALIDLSQTRNKLGYDKRHPYPAVRKLQDILRHRFIDKLFMLEDKTPKLSIKRMGGLAKAYDSTHHARRGAHTPEDYASVTSNYLIKIPRKILDLLAQDGFLVWEHGKLRASCAMICDTRDRLIRVIFTPLDKAAILVNVLHRDWPGVLAGMTDVIKQDFDILQCLTRPQKNAFNQFEAILFPMDHCSGTSKRALELRLKRALEADPTLEPIEMKITFPTGMGVKFKGRIPDDTKANRAFRYSGERYLHDLPPLQLLEQQRQTLLVQEKELLASSMESTEPMVQNYLRLEYIAAQKDQLHCTGNMFVSFSFKRNAKLYSLVSGAVGRKSLTIKEGIHANREQSICTEVMKSIADSAYFLAIWTPQGKAGEVSEWLLWECATAIAMGKQVYILMDSRISKKRYAYFYSAVRHDTFSDDARDMTTENSFDSKVVIAINALVASKQ